MGLRQGIEHIQQANERQKSFANRQGGTLRWIAWKDGDTKLVRFLTDANQLFVVFQHDYVPTVDGKKRTFICRKEFQAECPLCEVQTPRREVGYGIAVLRKEVMGVEDGLPTVVGFDDMMDEVDGKKVPHIGIICQSPVNFWTYVNAIHQKFGPLTSYDLEIKRQGADQTTSYIIFPNQALEIPEMDTKYKEHMIDLEGYLTNIGSQEYYSKNLSPSTTSNEPSPLPESGTDFDRVRSSLSS